MQWRSQFFSIEKNDLTYSQPRLFLLRNKIQNKKVLRELPRDNDSIVMEILRDGINIWNSCI